MAQKKAGPVITDEGDMIYDIDFDGILQPEDIDNIDKILHETGVVETGFFVNMADHAYFGQKNGSVRKQTNSNKQKNSLIQPEMKNDTK